jgi:hypothetical protein
VTQEVGWFCEYGDEPSGSIQVTSFLTSWITNNCVPCIVSLVHCNASSLIVRLYFLLWMRTNRPKTNQPTLIHSLTHSINQSINQSPMAFLPKAFPYSTLNCLTLFSSTAAPLLTVLLVRSWGLRPSNPLYPPQHYLFWPTNVITNLSEQVQTVICFGRVYSPLSCPSIQRT